MYTYIYFLNYITPVLFKILLCTLNLNTMYLYISTHKRKYTLIRKAEYLFI